MKTKTPKILRRDYGLAWYRDDCGRWNARLTAGTLMTLCSPGTFPPRDEVFAPPAPIIGVLYNDAGRLDTAHGWQGRFTQHENRRATA